MREKKRIFVAALNWGLGHATRCIPIIEALQKANVSVILGSDGQAGAFWRAHFPDLTYIALPAYGISYPYQSMFWNMATQLPRIYRTMRQERQMLADIVQQQRINAIISDNRFGLSHEKLFSVFMSHQINPIIPNFVLQKLAHSYYHRLIARFSQCWVVDTPVSDWAGQLSALGGTKLRGEYIGALSRFQSFAALQLPKLYEVIFCLSGVEPQRSIFEQLCLAQARLFPQKRFLLIKGLPDFVPAGYFETPNLEIRAFCHTAELFSILQQAETVVARAGYSTIMDFYQIGLKKVILVPTPAQTEQEFLAKRLQGQKIAYTCAQNNFNLAHALRQLADFSGFAVPQTDDLLATAVENLLARL